MFFGANDPLLGVINNIPPFLVILATPPDSVGAIDRGLKSRAASDPSLHSAGALSVVLDEARDERIDRIPCRPG